MTILLGLVVCALVGSALAIAGLIARKLLVAVLGIVMVLVAVGAGVAIKASCDPGCEVGPGQEG